MHQSEREVLVGESPDQPFNHQRSAEHVGSRCQYSTADLYDFITFVYSMLPAVDNIKDYENIMVDTCSSFYSLSPKTAEDLIHAYGTDKVMWATDFPMWESESEMEMFDKIDLSKSERNQILYENAKRLLNVKV